MEAEVKKWPKHKDHLNKTFLEELSYKLWSTKGIRFTAANRLLTMQDLSNKAIAMLSAYLIILSLAQVYNISVDVFINQSFIAFSITALSILLLVFTQMENAQDYKTKAEQFHKCSLEIGKLYEELRIFKTMGDKSLKEKEDFCQKYSDIYHSILDKYPNHDRIDYEMFIAHHPEYFEKGKFFQFHTKFKYYLSAKLLYHILIFLPPGFFSLFIILN